jgi:hypothetical protein
MTTKPKTRKAPAAKTTTTKAAPKEMELDADDLSPHPHHAIVEAEDILATASKLSDAIYEIAVNLNEYECGAICAVANAIRDKITVSLELLDSAQQPGRAASLLEAEKRMEAAGFTVPVGATKPGNTKRRPKAEAA